MLSWQYCSRRGEDKLLKWKGDSVRKRKRTTLTFMYVYRRPSVRPSVSHLVILSVFPARPHSRYNWPQPLLPSAVFTLFWQLTQNTRKTRRYLVLFQFVCLPQRLFILADRPWEAASRNWNPQPATRCRFIEPPFGTLEGGFLSAASAIDSLNYLDRRAPKPFSAQHKLPKSKRLSIRL